MIENKRQQKQIKDLVVGDLVISDNETKRVRQILSGSPKCPEWRIEWKGLNSEVISRVYFFPNELVDIAVTNCESE